MRLSRRGLLQGALLAALAGLLTGPPRALGDHERPGGTGVPAVESVAGAVTKYRHINPWACTNPKHRDTLSGTLKCKWNTTLKLPGEVHETSCERTIPPGTVITGVKVGETIGEVTNGRCGHKATDSGNNHWSFGGNDHPQHRNVVLETETRHRCALAGWDQTLQYAADGHPLGHRGDWCGTWTATIPTVSISGATVVEGERAVLAVEAASGFDGGSGSVSFETVAGTAEAGSDFRAVSGSHSLTDDGLSRQVIVETVDDDEAEETESFTVRLFDASGLVVGTASATVNITDNDSSAPDPQPPPHTGCNAAGTRLASLSVTESGSELLSGFSPDTFAYSVTAGSVTVLVRAAAADSSASLRFGAGGSGTGSASRTVYTSQGSSVTVDVAVTRSGQSCAYSLTVTRPAPPATDCPAWSGLILVDGTCVEACPGDDIIPSFDSEGQVTGCLGVGNCPHDLYGHDPSVHYPYRDFDPLWHDGGEDFPPVAAGGTATTTAGAVKCPQVWRINPFGSPGGIPHRCIWAESNLHPDGDCLKIVLSVEAVIPAVKSGSATRNWAFNSSGCGNASADRVEASTPWTPDDAACSSSEGSWGRSSFCIGCRSTEPTDDPGVWSVSVGDLSIPSGGGASSPYVDVPLQVEITDWGDASHLVVTATVIARDPVWWYHSPNSWGYGIRWPSTGPTTSVVVPRRSGPPPADDQVRVKIAEVAELPHSSGHRWAHWPAPGRWVPYTDNDQFVNILRSTLLANDACPIGVDCADPSQWPVRIAGDRAARCDSGAFEPTPKAYAMQPTSQGLVGCDDLNDTGDPDDPAGVRYWPRLWAAGQDTFTYQTYGGTATVTVAFTDTAPETLDAVVPDAGEHYAAAYYRYVRRRSCGWYSRCPGGRFTGYWLTYNRDDDTAFATPNRYHTGRLEIAVDDPDGDFASLRLIGAAEDGGAELRGGVMTKLQHANLYPTYGAAAARNPGQALDGATDTWHSLGAYGHRCLSTATASWHRSDPIVYPGIWAWDGPPAACRPLTACTSPLEAAELCWGAWGRDDGADSTVTVDYRACDARYDAARSDRPAFSRHLASVLAARWPHLTRTQIAAAVGNHIGGAWKPSNISTKDWQSIGAAVDAHIDTRQCSRAEVTLQLGVCSWAPTDDQRAALAAEVAWHSFLQAGPTGPVGKPWPPHPELPGGSRHIVIAGSPVWPRINDPADLRISSSGCAWSADWLQASATQMLPWNPAHRAAVEAHGGHADWLRVWDGLGADRQAEARALHSDGDLTSVQCPIAVAADPAEPSDANASYAQCRWELARPGVWHWTLDAGFSDTAGRTVADTLAEGITWFRSLDAYTTRQTFPGTG